MIRLSIVKQSDVSFGTALHYADDWTYGRNSLCGKPMRSTARDGEIGYKRMCGSCVKIMAKRVEKAHAEALLTQVELDHALALKIHAELIRDEMRTYAIHWDRVVDVEAAHAEALEIAKDRLDIPDFDEEAVYARPVAELSVMPGDRGDLINRGRALGFTTSMLLSDTDELRRLVEMHEETEAEPVAEICAGSCNDLDWVKAFNLR